jgi:hypothetical protein
MISILKCILWFCGLCFLFFPSASKSVSLCPGKIEGQCCGFMCVALYKYRFRVLRFRAMVQLMASSIIHLLTILKGFCEMILGEKEGLFRT